MSDERERAAVGGGAAEGARSLLERVRRGALAPERLELLASLGDPGARAALGEQAPPVLGLVAAVDDFLAWASSPPGEPDDEARRVFGLVTRLCHEVLALPPLELLDEEGPEVERADREEWQRVYRWAGALPVQTYALVSDALRVPGEEPVLGGVADDLADVYRDLDHGRRLRAQGEYGDAAWQWRFSFERHWGRHALCAARALYEHLARST